MRLLASLMLLALPAAAPVEWPLELRQACLSVGYTETFCNCFVREVEAVSPDGPTQESLDAAVDACILPQSPAPGVYAI